MSKKICTINNMIGKKANLTESEIRHIARSFSHYPYPSASFYGFRDRQMIERYIELTTKIMKSYCEIFSLDDKAYMMVSDESSVTPFLQYIRLLWESGKILGIRRMYEQLEEGSRIGFSQEVVLRKRKVPFIHIELLAVEEEYWGHKLMSELIAFAKSMARERKCLLILETDELHKMKKYVHLGFQLKKKRRIKEDVVIYDLFYDPESEKGSKEDQYE